MKDSTGDEPNKADEVRPSGVPGPHGLGASKKEAVALALALAAILLVIVGFWYEAGR